MANVVLGIGTSHGPQVYTPPSQWQYLAQKDIADGRMDYPTLLAKADPRLAGENTPEKWQQRFDKNQRALRVLKEKLDDVKPDAIVLVGDDQHEQFHENNMPMFGVYYGDSFTVKQRERENASNGSERRSWWATDAYRAAMEAAKPEPWPLAPMEVPAAPELARHLIGWLRENEFDIATSNELNSAVGLGHAFTFLYRFLHTEGTIPMVPIMVNTFFPPNQPTPRRCYALGQALRSAIEDWGADQRVAVISSGGLSHTVIDEELDHDVLDALAEKDRERLCSLPEEKLVQGTSENLNWVLLGGVMEPETMTLVDYVPCYRTPAGTGHADAFAYWE